MTNKAKNNKIHKGTSAEQSAETAKVKDKKGLQHQFIAENTKNNTSQNTVSKLVTTWKKYQPYILSFILSIYALPSSFSSSPKTSIDESWIKAINMAIKENIQFGT